MHFDAFVTYPEWALHVRILGGFISVLWVLEIADTLIFKGWLNRFGILPRRWLGLRGILLAPLLHGNLRHLSMNTVPLVVLGWLILVRSTQVFVIVTAAVWLIGGLGVWLFAGAKSNHIGASGLVFGYLGFLLMNGYVEQSLVAIATTILVGLLYGSTLWGVLPLQRGVSWQGHLFGVLTGGLCAYYLPQIQNWLPMNVLAWV
ncbi:rhomboid family intramembrane serine protease [Acaryochloris sp. 'Moss Beach']|uniref:rhomboid family intramembrane serine protease n=1 Tax=Acaryochloris sp. 'Moss Beach' TaxID=2740837 RepID=UPI001F470B24|nr:rhomboid family intramembrane serine protease [Acaryochloris sp. 'Moss Beach']UJB71595.1 rhomboid family intramembrane serine protease [Acaryochloris sp. 'Moss Beach']